jgi:hypothetical protein
MTFEHPAILLIDWYNCSELCGVIFVPHHCTIVLSF